MPETLLTNGYTNGHTSFEMEDGSNFLFTSESVGEGHPGKLNHTVVLLYLYKMAVKLQAWSMRTLSLLSRNIYL